MKRLTFEGAGDFTAETSGRNMHFGVREHAMGALLNGLALSKVRPYGAGFLIFSDYARPAIRLSALMELPTIHIFTHDSIGVGEDGPTHQPIEQLASLRAIPGLIVLRPADANEVVEASCYPAEYHRAALGRAGIHFRLGALHWVGGRAARHEDLRRVGAAPAATEEIRIYAGDNCRGSQGVGRGSGWTPGITALKENDHGEQLTI